MSASETRAQGLGARLAAVVVHLERKTDGELIAQNTAVTRLARLRYRVWHWSSLTAELPDTKRMFITLTYAEGQQVLNADLSAFTRWLRAQGAHAYCWVRELHKDDTEHIHAIAVMPASEYLPYPDKCGAWAKGFSNLIPDIRHAHYLMKYVSKARGDRMLRKGARMYAVWIDKARYTTLAHMLRAGALPEWVRNAQEGIEASTMAETRRMKGGGWVNHETGLYMPSEWAMRGIEYELTDDTAQHIAHAPKVVVYQHKSAPYKGPRADN